MTDPSSAVVPGAAITITNEATGFQRATVSDGVGNFVFAQLAPGAYRLEWAKSGFLKSSAPLVLEVNQRARIDIALKLGGTEHTGVTADVSSLNTEDASAGYRMDNAKIAWLPLAVRTVVSLVTLGPGRFRDSSGDSCTISNDIQEGSRGSVALNPPVSGARPTMNTFLLDRANDADRNTFAISVYPPMDSVQEFRIQTGLAPAEFPQMGGGAIDVVTKSGTKTFHGSGFEYFRNEATDARGYFESPMLPRPIFRQNQFGGSLGGPAPAAKNTFFTGFM